MNHNYSRSDLDPTLSTADKLHVHFGAGRLGFGLVLPALESAGSPYVIVNRPSAVWGPVVERERETQQHVGVKVRGTLPRRSFFEMALGRANRRGALARSPRRDLRALTSEEPLLSRFLHASATLAPPATPPGLEYLPSRPFGSLRSSSPFRHLAKKFLSILESRRPDDAHPRSSPACHRRSTAIARVAVVASTSSPKTTSNPTRTASLG